MPINYKNPIFQNKMLASMANPISNKLGLQQQLTAEHASNETQWQEQLANMGLSREINKSNMEHAYAKLNFRKDYFDRGMSNAKQAQKLSLYGGLGNALIAGWMGRQMRKDKERELAMRQKIYNRLDAKYGLLDEGVL